MFANVFMVRNEELQTIEKNQTAREFLVVIHIFENHRTINGQQLQDRNQKLFKHVVRKNCIFKNFRTFVCVCVVFVLVWVVFVFDLCVCWMTSYVLLYHYNVTI